METGLFREVRHFWFCNHICVFFERAVVAGLTTLILTALHQCALWQISVNQVSLDVHELVA